MCYGCVPRLSAQETHVWDGMYALEEQQECLPSTSHDYLLALLSEVLLGCPQHR